MSPLVFPDNTVMCNFASVDRLDLLSGWLRGRGRWTAAVAHEVTQSARVFPPLARVRSEGWLGKPIDFDAEAEIMMIERIRRVVFGGTSMHPLQHLGEAQTCYAIAETEAFRGAWWVTDDEDAYRYAYGRGIATYRTIDIVRNFVADGDQPASGGFDLMQAMADQGRMLLLPASPRDLQ